MQDHTTLSHTWPCRRIPTAVVVCALLALLAQPCVAPPPPGVTAAAAAGAACEGKVQEPEVVGGCAGVSPVCGTSPPHTPRVEGKSRDPPGVEGSDGSGCVALHPSRHPTPFPILRSFVTLPPSSFPNPPLLRVPSPLTRPRAPHLLHSSTLHTRPPSSLTHLTLFSLPTNTHLTSLIDPPLHTPSSQPPSSFAPLPTHLTLTCYARYPPPPPLLLRVPPIALNCSTLFHSFALLTPSTLPPPSLSSSPLPPHMF
jgi:hypothetical protein